MLAGDVAPGIQHVGEDATRAAEDVILKLDALVDRDVVLDLDVIADPGPRHHHHILAEAAPLANDRTGHHVAEVPDLGAAADDRAVVDEARGMNEKISHLLPSRTSVSIKDKRDG